MNRTGCHAPTVIVDRIVIGAQQISCHNPYSQGTERKAAVRQVNPQPRIRV